MVLSDTQEIIELGTVKDDETVYVDLGKVNPAIQALVFCCHYSRRAGKTSKFQLCQNAFIRLSIRRRKASWLGTS